MQNNKSEQPNGSFSVSDIQDDFEHIIKKQKTLPINPPIHIYNRINNRLIFKIKDE